MRPELKLPTALLVILACCLGLSSPGLAADDINRIVLRVNNQVATLHDYEERKAVEVTRILSNPNLDPNQRQEMLDKIGRDVMQNLFSELLLLSFADQQAIRVQESEVQEALQQVMERQGMRNISDLQQALDTYGMSLEQLRDNLRRDLLWNQVIGREVHGNIDIGDEELRAYYRNNQQQFQVSEKRWLKEIIVLESATLSGDELTRKAGEIRQELANGGEFETLAETYKEQEITTGIIDLGWLTEDELEKNLAEAAWQLQNGEYSAPTPGRGGLHIFYLVEAEEASIRPFEEVEEQIYARERSIRFEKELRSFMARIEQNAYVRENLPPEAVGYKTASEGFEPEEELGGFLSPLDSTDEASGEEAEAVRDSEI